jgi:hypothetical protein
LLRNCSEVSFKLGNELVNIFRNASIGTTVIFKYCFNIFKYWIKTSIKTWNSLEILLKMNFLKNVLGGPNFLSLKEITSTLVSKWFHQIRECLFHITKYGHVFIAHAQKHLHACSPRENGGKSSGKFVRLCHTYLEAKAYKVFCSFSKWIRSVLAVIRQFIL